MKSSISRAAILAFSISVAYFAMLAQCSMTGARAEEEPKSEVEIASVEASPESLSAWQHRFSPEDEKLLDEIQFGCFQYFMKEIGDPALLAKDKTSDTIASIAAVGFELSALPVGVEHGWISREEGQRRALTILRSLIERTDNKKFGIYLHFLDERTGGLPDFSRTKYHYELQASTIDHALLQAGAMTAGTYFGGEVAKLADQMIADADWRAMYDDKTGELTMGWRAETDNGPNGPGTIPPNYWHWCSDEERLALFLAVGSPHEKHALEPASYYQLKRIVKRYAPSLAPSRDGEGNESGPPYVVSWGGSLFSYFFAHCWIDYRHLAADNPAAFNAEGPRVDWFENSRRATLTQRRRCIEASGQFPTLGENRWGLAPCAFRDQYLVHEIRPSVRNVDEWHGGVVPPYGAGSAIMFTPVESMAALREYRSLKGPDGKPLAWRDPQNGGYAFVDSFSLDPPYGHDDNLGIDCGPMLLAIENARTGRVWQWFMAHPSAKAAVERLQLKPRD